MSYLNFPRIHFSGTFKAYPSTINNIPSNYESSIYPNIEEVQLVWAPKGNGEFSINGKVTMVEYEDGTTASTPEEDPIIGQPLISMPNPHFIPGALVDLDPEQQMVSELWGMRIQIGGEDAYLRGNYAPAAFDSMWGNVQGPNPPQSSASASVMYQSVLTDLQTQGLSAQSKFLNYFESHPVSKLSINFAVNSHNNNPVLYSFNPSTFSIMLNAGVPQSVLDKIEPMQQMTQQHGVPSIKPGDIPTQDFVTFQLQQFLTTEEYNANIDNILKLTQIIQYQPTTPYEFSNGFICGSVGTSTAGAPDYFVPSRMLSPFNSGLMNFAPFAVADDGKTISVNLCNSIPVKDPGTVPYEEKLGELQLVYFPNAEIDSTNAQKIATIHLVESDFLEVHAGMFTAVSDVDVSSIPLGIISIMSDGSSTTKTIILAENKDGYYLRANQFVFRMNPGVESTLENPRGDKTPVEIHAYKFGQPVPDNTQISIGTIPQQHPSKIPPLYKRGVPSNALTVSPASGIAETINGVARFVFTATDPGNPRGSIDGQIYFKSYQFTDPTIWKNYTPNSSYFISVQVYDQHPPGEALEVLNKYGYLYKVMSFLADDTTVEGIDMRNMIKTLLQKPFSDIRHMPVTRDLSIANRQKIIDWIDQLNNS